MVDKSASSIPTLSMEASRRLFAVTSIPLAKNSHPHWRTLDGTAAEINGYVEDNFSGLQVCAEGCYEHRHDKNFEG